MNPDDTLKEALGASLRAKDMELRRQTTQESLDAVDIKIDPVVTPGTLKGVDKELFARPGRIIPVDGPIEVGGWPDPATVPTKYIRNVRHYVVGGRALPSVTSVLKVLGLATEPLVAWAARTEREACLEAARKVWATWPVQREHTSAAAFVVELEKALGTERAHQRELAKAGEIGTSIHQAIQTWLTTGQQPTGASDVVTWAFMAAQDWWRTSGLTLVRSEQPVWDLEHGYAGTIDLVAEDPELGLGLIDFKTGKGVYDEAHLQVAGYIRAAKTWADLKWAKIVRLPKVATDPDFEVKELGRLYDRVLTLEELDQAFLAALTAWRLLKSKEGA